MASENHKDLILEAIDQLRKRKARPDLERICHMLERKHGISFVETEADLDKLVEEEVVVKVDYKGSTSYRNAAKWKKSHIALASNDTSRKLHGAVRSLQVGTPSKEGEGLTAGEKQATTGVSVEDIEKWLVGQDSETSMTGDNLTSALVKEVEAGRLDKLEDDTFVLNEDYKETEPRSPNAKSKWSKPKTPSKKSASGGSKPPKSGKSDKTGPSPGKKPRSIKRKRVKKIDGPVFESASDVDNMPADLDQEEATPVKVAKTEPEQESPSNSSPASSVASSPSNPPPPPVTETTPTQTVRPLEEDGIPKCDYCLMSSGSNRKGEPEELLVCKDCQAKAHPSCMDYSEDLAKRAIKSPWQCIDCKTCTVCEDSGDPDAMLFCDACDKGYHMSCHTPPVTEKPGQDSKWVCSLCLQELGLEEGDVPDLNQEVGAAANSADGGGASCLPTPSESPVQFLDPAEHRQNILQEAQNNDTNKQNGYVVPVKVVPKPAPLPRLADTLPVDVPDASDWTIEDTYQYFYNVGFIEQAEVFRDQEIDGKSLLLMKRSDVLTGLSLKLGPALKIYAHVQRLQTRGQPII